MREREREMKRKRDRKEERERERKRERGRDLGGNFRAIGAHSKILYLNKEIICSVSVFTKSKEEVLL